MTVRGSLALVAAAAALLAAPMEPVAGAAATSAAKADKKEKAKSKRAKAPTAKQCTKKAIRKLKVSKRRARQKACAKRKSALRKKPAKAKRGQSAAAVSTATSPAATPAAGARPAKPATRPSGPFDYRSIEGLSQAVHETVRVTVKVPGADGAEQHLEIVKPAGAGRFPVLLNASPYHGGAVSSDREGGEVEGGLSKWFAPRGYAVAFLDHRGTGLSHGCMDWLGTTDSADLRHLIQWLAAQDWSNGNVAMIGTSTPGAATIAGAATGAPALKTVVPIAAYPSPYEFQFQSGVPFFFQWGGAGLGLLYYWPAAYNRPTENPQDNACGPGSGIVSGEDQLSGRYSAWHAERDWTEEAVAAPIPIFAIHGVGDQQVRSNALRWFDRRNHPGDKLMLGNWGHSEPPRGTQWKAAITAWFDRHLKGRDIETGPRTEVFFTDGSFQQSYDDGKRDEMLTASQWPLDTTPVTFRPAADGTMSTSVPAAGTKAFAGTAAGFGNGEPGGALAEETQPIRETVPRDGAIFTTAPLDRDIVVAGFPEMRLSASMTAERVHLIATLYDEPPAGARQRRRIGQLAIQPELRDGRDKVTPVIPAQRYDLKPSAFAMAHHLRPGHRLVLRISTSDPDKTPLFANDPNVTVFTGPGATEVTLPTVSPSQLQKDTLPTSD